MRAVLIDDSEIDRLNLRSLLGDHPQIEVVGEADTVESAVAMIDKQKPDLVFLDIHLGRQKGFKALEQIKVQPKVIITTSHPHYALKGFEINAVDYLLKPIMEDALARAIGRLMRDEERSGGASPATRLDEADVQIFKEADGMYVVPVSHIIAILGERVYARVIIANGKEYLHNRPLREWISILPEKQFKVLDRSTIVNIRLVKSVNPNSILSFRGCPRTLELGPAALKALRDMM